MNPITREQAAEALHLVQRHGGIRAAARNSKLSYGALQERYKRAQTFGLDQPGEEVIDIGPVVRGRVHALPRSEWPVPEKGKVARYIFTCAQNNTHLHEGTWQNLLALANHYEATIHVSTFTYDKASYGKKSVKKGTKKTGEDSEDLWYDDRLTDYLLDKSVIVAPGLIWCGEMNILPTAVRPLSGFESYTGRASGIFPHVKFAMESVASGKHEGTKFNYTTGTVTQRNYIQKKAGLKAEFHHGYGAVIAEVDSGGSWWVRQLNADSEGTIYDLDLCASDGVVTSGHRLEAVGWGDIHVGTVSRETMDMQWGEGGMIDVLRPKYQFMHDVLDFRSRNYHDAKNPHKLFEKFTLGVDGVADELRAVADFLHRDSKRPWCETVVVDSNHDNALKRWLREGDYRYDPKNALLFLELQLKVYRSIYDRDRDFHLLETCMRKMGVTDDVRFLREDDSFIICKSASGGIECAMHGHLGPNGARGNHRQFARMGRKSNTAHEHSPSITDGNYCGGITGDLEQGYNAGPSSWSRSHVLTYANGKRTIITCWRGKWRAAS
jgi:hypothetical protein